MTDKDVDDVFQQQKQQKRHRTEPTEDRGTESDSLEDAIVTAFSEIDNGDRPQNLTVRDQKLAALFAGVEETDGLEDLMTRVYDALGTDAPAKVTRANVLRGVIRLGLVESVPDIIETTGDAHDQHTSSEDVI